MKSAPTLVLAIAGVASALQLPVQYSQFDASKALKRATPQAPNGYAPAEVACPAQRPSIRDAHGMSPEERSWLKTRRKNTIQPMQDLLERLGITGFDAGGYIQKYSSNISALPNIAIAASGGGYRALMNGAGALAAFDIRTPNSTAEGHLGGLLQSATYLAGLSGGSWLVGTIYVNNFTSVYDIITADDQVWDFTNSVLEGPDQGIQLLSSVDYYKTLYDEVKDKSDAGYNISVTDYWGRALSFQLVNATDGGPAYTFSSIADDAMFSAGDTPLPIFVADGRAPGQLLVPYSTTIYEFNPWEMGSWDPTVFGFAPTRYIGSEFSAGSLPSSKACIAGFDNAGFVMGTSSSLFNQVLLQIGSSDTSVPSFVVNAIEDVLTKVGDANNDIADYQPNPFRGYHPSTNGNAGSDSLTLVDGGEDLQNIPFHPLIQPPRAVDVIFAIDSSADTVDTHWPNGTSLVASYQRAQDSTGIANGTPFPPVPDTQSMVNLGLNSRPTFFGCNVDNYTTIAQRTPNLPPLIVYIPNAPYAYFSNFSTYDLSYNNSVRNAVIQNGYDVATMGNATVAADWPACVGCAILQRSLIRTGEAMPSVCQDCFSKYCWDGSTNTTVEPEYAPALKLSQHVKTSAASRTSGKVWLMGLLAAEAAWLVL